MNFVNFLFCLSDPHNENYIREKFKDQKCIKKRLVSESTENNRKVLVLPKNYDYTTSSNNFYSMIYDSLPFAFLNETNEMSKMIFPPEISFYFLKTEYEIFHHENFSSSYFHSLDATINLKPLYCSIDNIPFCFLDEIDFLSVKIVFFFASYDLSFFIFQKMNISNIIFDGVGASENNFVYQENSLFSLESNGGNNPILILENTTFRNLKFMNYIKISDLGRIFVNNLLIENCSFEDSFFRFNPINNMHSSIISFTNVIFKEITSFASESSIFIVTGLQGECYFENIAFLSITSNQDISYIFYFENLPHSPLNLKKIFITNCYNYIIFKLSTGSFIIEEIFLSNSSFLENSIFLDDKSTTVSIYNMKVISCMIEKNNEYFILNNGNLDLDYFTFYNLKNLQIMNIDSDFSLMNGTIIESISNRLLIYDSSSVNLRNISFFMIYSKTSLFLFYLIKNVEIRSLFLKNISSESCLVEVQNLINFTMETILFKHLNIYYFMSPMPSLSLLTLNNISFSNLICYRLFYITVKIEIFFSRFYLSNIPIITGSYFFQFMRNSIKLESIVFEEIYGNSQPASMFHLSGGSVSIKNSAFLNIGWRTNDTTSFFSIDDNAVLYFFQDKSVEIDNCIFITMNLSLHTGYIDFVGGTQNTFLISNSYFLSYQNFNLYAMGMTILNAFYLNFTNNIFQGLVCPKSDIKFLKMMHINGPLAIIGDAVYSKKINSRTAILTKNIFQNCNCKTGGSLCLINYNNILIKECIFLNSSSDDIGGILALISIGRATISSIMGNFSMSRSGAIAAFIDSDSIDLNNSHFSNIYGEKIGAFDVINTKELRMSQIVTEKIISQGKGAFLNQNGFSSTLIQINIFFSQKKEGDIYISNKANSFILNSTVFHSYSSLNAGFLSIDFGNIINMTNVKLLNVSSFGSGGALIVRSVSTFIINNLFINYSKSEGSGILYFKSSNESSILIIDNLVCLENKVKLHGSCIFFDSQSKLFIKSIQIKFCEGTPLVFLSPLVTTIILENIYMKENKFAIELIRIDIISSYINNLFLENNYALNENNEIYIITLVGNEFCSIKNVTFQTNESERSIILFNLKQTTTNFTNIPFIFNKTQFFSFLVAHQSTIGIFDSFFKNLSMKSFEGFFNVDSCILMLFSCIFIETMAPIIYAIESTLSIKNSSFYLIKNPNHSNEIYLETSEADFFLILEHTIMEGFSGKMVFASCRNILVSSSIFVNYNETISSISLFLSNVKNLDIDRSHFSGFHSLSKGSAISLANPCEIKLNISLKNSYFFNNSALLGAGVFVSANSDIYINFSIFKENKAIFQENYLSGIGGSIYFDSCDKEKNIFVLQNNIFSFNFADSLLPDIFSSVCFNFFNNSFDSADDGSLKYLSLPFNIAIINESISIKPGIAFDISFKLVDCHQEILIFDDASIGNINSQAVDISQNILMRSNVAKSSNGVLSFKNIIINLNPEIEIYLIITITLQNELIKTKEKIQKYFFFNTSLCSKGEILMSDKKCYKCSNGTYSSNDFPGKSTNICLKCPENAFCWDGFYIIPNYGFWKSSRNSTLIVPCLIPDACVNDLMNNSETKCAEFQEGNLCNKCQKNYGKMSSSELCVKCSDIETVQIVRSIFIIVFAIIYIFFSANNILKTKEGSIADPVFKIIINHLQRITTVYAIEFELDISFKGIVNIFEYLKIFSEEIISNDCFLQAFFQNLTYFQFYKLLFSLVLPFFISVLCVITNLIYTLIMFLRKKKNDVKIKAFFVKFYVYLLICAFLLYSFLIKTSLNFLSCTSLSNDPRLRDQEFVKLEPNMRCWDGIHFTGAILACVFGIIAWGFFYPFILWGNIKVSLAKKINEKQKQLNNNVFNERTFNFFYKDYKSSYYYWECIIFLQKLLLNILCQAGNWFDDKYFKMACIIMLLIYFYYVLKLQPFQLKVINYLESLSLFACILTNISTLGISSSPIPLFLKFFFYIIMLTCNLAFIFESIKILIKYTKWRELICKTKLLFSKIRNSEIYYRRSIFQQIKKIEK